MYKKFLAFTLLNILIGCGEAKHNGYALQLVSDYHRAIKGRQTPDLPPTVVEPGLQPYYDSFLADSDILNGSLARGLADVSWASQLDSGNVPSGEHTVGICSWSGYKEGALISHVLIRKQPWDGYAWSEYQLKAVVYHELGHCLLGLGHTPEGSGQIMDPVLYLDDRELQRSWDVMVGYEFQTQKNNHK